ncbi:NAD(P)/FAD-dependent oxidoreductase [Humidisolicoccus flavus]|uniref:NAD(P)/FAD-dependent oxidoreductase n=1 Tax=Humidisolicoccus flavus TaxID=3111414 RepID=UPI003251E892
MDADVIVIGAGLAGLQAARRAEANGQSVIVLEAQESVGGRVRTERIDGFLCDRGFQLLNPAYPAVQESIDCSELELQKFGVGVIVRKGAKSSTLAHPLRHPQYALQTLRSGFVPMLELAAFARWIGPEQIRPALGADDLGDESLQDSFDRVGLTGSFRRNVLDTFLAGVLAESSGASSANYVRQLVRYFATGTPGLPKRGMQALPEQMARALAGEVRVNTPVQSIKEVTGGVAVSTADATLRARAVVVAVGPEQVSELTALRTPPSNGLTTWWFRATGQPKTGPFLLIDASRPGGGPAGPVWNTAVISEVAPSYAPPGEHLVQATTLLDRPDGRASEADIRRDLARLYKTSTKRWEVLVHHEIPHTLPAQPPPLQDRGPIWTGTRILVTGDHRETGSIQGALVSGNRAAKEVATLFARS